MTAKVLAKLDKKYNTVINNDCLEFLGFLHHHFESRRQELLAARVARQGQYDSGKLPDFLPETAHIRSSDWRCAPPPKDMLDRRVEITGPVDRKMVINALNSGAKLYMADFEDSTAPTFLNQVDGQLNMYDAVRRQIDFTASNGKTYKLKPATETAVLMVRARGWHLDEAHVTVNGAVMSGSLFDFGVHFFNNAKELLSRGSGPYFYLPKMQSYLEARLWNDVFVAAQNYTGVAQGSIKATCLIETLPAVFEMDEILFELKDHSVGLNCGRWDYVFSYIKTLRMHPQYVLPDRGQVGMTAPFMDAYVKLLIRTCHRRGIFAMGGMAALIPIKDDEARNQVAMEGVRVDKLREVTAGHDGTWVAHPGLVKMATKVFDENMTGPNQIYSVPKAGWDTTQRDLLAPSSGTITREGLRENIEVSIAYTEAWIRGIGCIPLYNKMEDAATAEISRTQVWQWLKHGVQTCEGVRVTAELVKSIVEHETAKLATRVGPGNKAEVAGTLLGHMMTADTLPEFIPSLAYPHITQTTPASSL